MIRHAFAAATLAVAAAAPAFAHDDAGFPEHFRSFMHVTTGIVTPGFMFNGVDLGAAVPGMHNIYANEPATRGYRNVAAANGRGFNDGSVIAFDLWETGVLNSGTGSFTFPARQLAVAVMEKNARKYAATGGWGFQVYAAGSRTPLLDAAAQQQCFACHQVTPGTDFVFSRVAR